LEKKFAFDLFDKNIILSLKKDFRISMNQTATCFLIDDDSDDQEIFSIALEELGMPVQCIVASNGIEALERLHRDVSLVPDFIFIDLNMPRMSGRECLEEIKKIPRLAQVPIIIYSTSSEQKDIEETRRLGANHFLTKPVTISMLTKRLNEFFHRRKNQVVTDYQI
jgi:CheY-like chemotaxis protein